jgi:hypothetical protein
LREPSCNLRRDALAVVSVDDQPDRVRSCLLPVNDEHGHTSRRGVECRIVDDHERRLACQQRLRKRVPETIDVDADVTVEAVARDARLERPQDSAVGAGSVSGRVTRSSL